MCLDKISFDGYKRCLLLYFYVNFYNFNCIYMIINLIIIVVIVSVLSLVNIFFLNLSIVLRFDVCYYNWIMIFCVIFFFLLYFITGFCKVDFNGFL